MPDPTQNIPGDPDWQNWQAPPKTEDQRSDDAAKAAKKPGPNPRTMTERQGADFAARLKDWMATQSSKPPTDTTPPSSGMPSIGLNGPGSGGGGSRASGPQGTGSGQMRVIGGPNSNALPDVMAPFRDIYNQVVTPGGMFAGATNPYGMRQDHLRPSWA